MDLPVRGAITVATSDVGRRCHVGHAWHWHFLHLQKCIFLFFTILGFTKRVHLFSSWKNLLQ